MPRATLPEERIHEDIRQTVTDLHADIVAEVESATHAHPLVVVGMAQNPFVRKARKLLDQKSVPYHYLEYGSYLNTWRRRTALKMWTGWPTFPMVFHEGVLIGGFAELRRHVDSGAIR
ncbi:MAG: glutaredoxin [Myxococcota bacterium]